MARKNRKETIFKKRTAGNFVETIKDLNPEIQETHIYQAR